MSRIADTFGGINLEDIKAPECFEIESALIERCDIPVFHDDQHGTAIVTAAGLINALEIQGKRMEDGDHNLPGCGLGGHCLYAPAGQHGRPARKYLYAGSSRCYLCGREGVNAYKQEFANHTDKRSLTDAINGADVFIGLSGADLLSAEMLLSMADRPVVFACSNPDPEIKPELALATRDDLIIATGRSDYPNQVNNVLGFPFIFRGALDVRASASMKR